MNIEFFRYVTSGTETIGIHKGKTVYDYYYPLNGVHISVCSLNAIHHPSRGGELKQDDVVYVSIGDHIVQGKEAFYLLKSVLRIANV